MRIGAVDIGTNSVRLLIGEKTRDHLDRLSVRREVPRLGEDINKTGYLKKEAVDRTVEVLAEYKSLIDEFNAVPAAVATSAVRDAENQQEFITRAKEEAGIEVEPISGDREAYLSYLGVISELKDLEKKRLVIDIGGGSTEFIRGEEEELLTYNSINLGAVRLKEKFGDSISELKTRVEEKLDFLAGEFSQLIGVGGTITTLAAVKQKLDSYDRDKVQGAELTKKDVQEILDRLSNLSLVERKEISGLEAKRADIIIPGIIILLGIMNEINLKKILVSDAGILEGIVYEKN